MSLELKKTLISWFLRSKWVLTLIYRKRNKRNQFLNDNLFRKQHLKSTVLKFFLSIFYIKTQLKLSIPLSFCISVVSELFSGQKISKNRDSYTSDAQVTKVTVKWRKKWHFDVTSSDHKWGLNFYAYRWTWCTLVFRVPACVRNLGVSLEVFMTCLE